jgi:hypothetical protein
MSCLQCFVQYVKFPIRCVIRVYLFVVSFWCKVGMFVFGLQENEYLNFACVLNCSHLNFGWHSLLTYRHASSLMNSFLPPKFIVQSV